MGNWIAVDRDIRKHWLWKEPDKLHAWLDLLMLANWENKKLLIDNEIRVIPRGSFFTAERVLATRWGWSRGKIRQFLQLLQKDEMIILDLTAKGTTIKIKNYEKYQCVPELLVSEKAHKQDSKKTTNRTTLSTKINNITIHNNNTKIKIPFSLVEAQSAWVKFLKYRREIKKPISKISQQSILKKWASAGAERFSQAIEQSIANGWVGIFEQKESKQELPIPRPHPQNIFKADSRDKEVFKRILKIAGGNKQ